MGEQVRQDAERLTNRDIEDFAVHGESFVKAKDYDALLAELEQAERGNETLRSDFQTYRNKSRLQVQRLDARLAKVPALAKWTHHHSSCARTVEAGECDCGLNDAWRDLGLPEEQDA